MSNLSFFEDEERKLRFIKRRAQAKFRQQFRHHGLELDGDDYEAVIANKFNFGIELKSQDQPVDGVEDQVRSEGKLALEYAARYVEKVGATPTPETMRLVLDNIPLSKCHVNAAWRSRGWLADRLYVNPHHQGESGLGDDPADEDAGIQGGTSSAFAQPRRIDVSTLANIGVNHFEKFEASLAEKREDDDFNALKSKFVFPFNLKDDRSFGERAASRFSERVSSTRGRARSRSGKRSAGPSDIGDNGLLSATKETSLASKASNEQNARHLGGAKSGFSRVVQALEIAWEEVLHPLEVTAKDIKTLQVRFFDTFPFHLLDEKMNDDDVDEVGALLVSENVLQLIGLVCHYLYWAVIYTRVVSVSESYSTQSGELLGVRARRLSSFYEQSSSSSLSPSKGMATAEFTFELPQEEDEAKRTHRIKGIFLAIQTTYAKIEAMTKRNRHAILFHHPLLLLSIRSAVESIFSEEYPLWLTFESEERAWETGNRRHSTSFPSVPSAVGNDGGAAALDGRHSWGSSLYIMDNILTEFFDPNSYHSHITPLESSAHAIRIAQYAKRIDRSRRGKRPARNDQHSAEETVEKVQREGQEDVEHKHGDDLEDKTAREALGDLAHWLPVRPEPGIGRKRQRSERTRRGRRTKIDRSRSSRANSLSRYYTTSALVRSMYPEPRSGKARQLMIHGGHAASSGHASPLHSIMREPVGFAGDSQTSREARATRKELGKVALHKLKSRYEKDAVAVRKYHDRIGLLTEMA